MKKNKTTESTSIKLLAIDTSGDACSAALFYNGECRQRLEAVARRHGELMLPMMDGLLADAGLRLGDLDAIAFGRGPGSFTGVRIATAIVQGVAFGADLPVVPVSTLAALATGENRRSGHSRLATAFDARMGELYWGCFEVGLDGLPEAVLEEQVADVNGIQLPDGEGWHGVGAGWEVHGDRLRARFADRLDAVNPDALCEARDIAVIAAARFARGEWVEADAVLPIYLRDRVTAK